MNKKVVFLPYDMDTAIGINNEGALVFGYNLEDTDTVNGADVFNGQHSVLWCNLRDAFGPELKALYQALRSSGALSYDKVEQAFEEHQAKWPEAVFNEDAFYKYIQPLIEDGDESYLSMLQGSKAEQRKWWLYNRFKYIDSKYNAGDALVDRIQLRGYAKDNIVVTPYADIYATIRYGSILVQQRASRNVAYEIECPLDNVNDTEIYVYSASQLKSIGDLSGLKVGFADFHLATKMQDLILGSTESGYTNTNLRSINVGNLKLLKKIDARNCVGLGSYADQKSVDLSGCVGIEEVYFDGTNILGVELPNGGFLKKLHLPGTITNLTVRNQTHVTEFVCPDFSNVSTLNLENTFTQAQISSIIDDVAEGCRVRLFNYYWEFNSIADVMTFLDKFSGLTGLDQNGDNVDTPQIYATVHVPTATGDQIDAIHENFPDITVDADVATYNLRYYDTEGENVLYTETVQKNQNGTWQNQPTHSPTAQYTYAFAGWSLLRNSSVNDPNALLNLTQNRNVYAAYTKTVRTYTVVFKNSDGTVLQTVTDVPYGGTAQYTGSTPIHPTEPEGMLFIAFNPDGSNIIGATECIAAYQDANAPYIKYLKRTLTEYDNDTVDTIGQYAFANCTELTRVRTAATTIGASAFSSCARLKTFELTSEDTPVAISNNAISGCQALVSYVIHYENGISLATLSNNPVYYGELLIYVPDDLVDDYRNDTTRPRQLRDRIRPLSAYPITDLSTIDMTWTQIKNSIDDESFFSSNYALHDLKKVEYTDGETSHLVYFEIAKIDTTNKFVDFIVKNPDESTKFYNSSNNYDSYSNSFAKARLDAIYANELPSDLKAVITPVTKQYCIPGGDMESVTVPLWLLNTKDVNFTGTSLKESEGENYPIFSSGSDRIKVNRLTGVITVWNLGSSNGDSNGTTNHMNVGTGGTPTPMQPINSNTLVFGFRIQKT